MHTFAGAKATTTDMISPSVMLDCLGIKAPPSPAVREEELMKSCSQNCQIRCIAHKLLSYIFEGITD